MGSEWSTSSYISILPFPSRESCRAQCLFSRSCLNQNRLRFYHSVTDYNIFDCCDTQSDIFGWVLLAVFRSSATLRILRGTKTFWSRFFPCNAHRRSVKKYKYWVGRVPAVPPCSGAHGCFMFPVSSYLLSHCSATMIHVGSLAAVADFCLAVFSTDQIREVGRFEPPSRIDQTGLTGSL